MKIFRFRSLQIVAKFQNALKAGRGGGSFPGQPADLWKNVMRHPVHPVAQSDPSHGACETEPFSPTKM